MYIIMYQRRIRISEKVRPATCCGSKSGNQATFGQTDHVNVTNFSDKKDHCPLEKAMWM
jgi:hypothetical protein